jgi:hypothetical protein
MNVAPIHLAVSAGDLRKQNRSPGHAIEGCSPPWRPASLRCNSHIPLSLLSCFTRSVAPIDFPPACPHHSLAMQYGVAVIRNPLRLPPHYADFIKGWDLDFASTFPIAVFVTHPYSSCSFLVLTRVVCFLRISTIRCVSGFRNGILWICRLVKIILIFPAAAESTQFLFSLQAVMPFLLFLCVILTTM